MSIQIRITPKELRAIKSQLRKGAQIVCLNTDAFVKVTLVARDMLMSGQEVKAKIVNGAE